MLHGFVCLKSKACEHPDAGNKKNRFSEINKKSNVGRRAYVSAVLAISRYVSEEYSMDLHAKDKTQHPENVELLSAQKPITDFKDLLTSLDRKSVV